VVCLGKFDAMHRGHAQLAARASQMGAPYLMSFSGMAEVLEPPCVLNSKTLFTRNSPPEPQTLNS
jgi:FAD synthase